MPYNKDYDPKKDTSYGSAIKLDYTKLYCPLSLAGTPKLCLMESCALWAYRTEGCILAMSVNQLGYAALTISKYFRNEDRKKGFDQNRDRMRQSQQAKDDGDAL